jgi:hypothetical protein
MSEFTVELLDTLWLTAPQSKDVLPLRSFVSEMLSRGQTTFATLQTALIYILRLRLYAPEHFRSNPYTKQKPHPVICCRRMFLTCLVIAHKYLSDRAYLNSAWTKVTGLSVAEINFMEREVLRIINYKLEINEDTFRQWSAFVIDHVSKNIVKHKLPMAGPVTCTAPILRSQ